MTAIGRTGRRAVLVTGASTGIGRACVQHLSGSGYEVFAGVRRREDADRALAEGGGRVEPLLLDVTDEAGLPLRAVVPVDLYPGTYHVLTVALAAAVC